MMGLPAVRALAAESVEAELDTASWAVSPGAFASTPKDSRSAAMPILM